MYAQLENKEKSPFKFHRASEITIGSSAQKFRKETHNKTNKQIKKKVLMLPEGKVSKKKKNSDGNILKKREVPIIVWPSVFL